MKPLSVILSGGGTGGHIYPAIAIANEIKRRHPQSNILFVGAKDRMEMQKVPKAGYPIQGLWISGIQRKLTLKNFMFPFKLISSLVKSRRIIKTHAPDIVIGTGGFASGPLLKVANSMDIGTLIQEQNSYAGITNKWLAGKANTICVAYDGMERYFPSEKIVLTGNPVRQDLLEITSKTVEANTYFNLDPTKKTVLVLGGSQGAGKINQLIAGHLSAFKELDIQLIWQTGSNYYTQFKDHETGQVLVKEFIYRMDLAYAAADVIISRAGAGSVSELCIVGKPVIFIPSPNVSEDHQTKNALAIAKEHAALMLKEAELEEKFLPEFKRLLEDSYLQTSLSVNIKKLAKPNATKEIVDEVEKLITGK
ncbi:undecaprenyldiphospho-muramoylpentapeptide beta-N-acetylglucosaminyltransferase [Gangjinia marincola]|uniref:UDP-N-acetylglucosamine--N-acetylmuramyl-(pentapeptide) pyrophosphoryl-undecaprenol N-acetylglucosamine transferase n=1 Tax=Gangjinia marincola TaxID=578463 RepID=A0ABP3XV23_9FLAO